MSNVFEPSDKLNPSFRQEDQHMAEELKPVIVGPPAFASPDPATSVGGMLPVEQRPKGAAKLADDYGDQAREVHSLVDERASTLSEEVDTSDRSEWKKADWETQAEKYGLAKSGTVAEITQRVTDYEEEIAADRELSAEEWVVEIEDAENADELGSVRERYGLAGASYPEADEAFTTKQSEFDNSGANS